MNGAYPQMAWMVARVKMRQPARTWAWERDHGQIPKGSTVRSTCGQDRCVNPAHGQVLSHAEARQTPPEVRAERFWARVDRSAGTDGCWLWTGPVDPKNGYGRTTWTDGPLGAHQAAFELGNGWRPSGRDMYVCHRCDRPLCCNPAHLYAGTPKRNSADREERGRARRTHGTKSSGAKLTEDQVREIRRRHAAGGTSYPKLAAEFGLHPQNIGRVVRGEGYTDVEMSAADLRALVPADVIGLGLIKMTPARERAIELARATAPREQPR